MPTAQALPPAAPFTEQDTGIADTGKRLAWYRSPIDRAVLLELNRRNDWRPLLHHVGMLAFSAATGALAWWAYGNVAWPWVVAAVFLHCTFYGSSAAAPAATSCRTGTCSAAGGSTTCSCTSTAF